MSAYSAIWSAPGPLGPSRKLWPRTLSKRDVAKLREEGRRTKKGQVDLEVRGGWALKPGDHTTTSRARQLGLLAHRGPRVNRAVPASLYEGPPIPKWKQEVAKETVSPLLRALKLDALIATLVSQPKQSAMLLAVIGYLVAPWQKILPALA